MKNLQSVFNKFKNGLLSSGSAFAHDLVMIPIAWLLAYWIRFNLGYIPVDNLYPGLTALMLVVPIQILAYWRFGLYRGIWRFASMADMMRIVKATLLGSILLVVTLFIFTRMQGIPRSVLILYPIILVLLLAGPRFIYRWFKDHRLKPILGKRVLIIGAGSAGEMLARDLLKEKVNPYTPVAFIDDNPRISGHEIHGVRVAGATRKIQDVVNEYEIELIILAIPGATAKQMRRIVRLCSKTGVPFRTLPRLQDFVTGQSTVQELREVSIDDLLGRDQVELDTEEINRGIFGKTVLVSGAGGSIGSELCRQISKYSPKELILIDSSEYNLYQIHHELSHSGKDIILQRRLVDVTDRVAVEYILKKFRPNIIYHAAAYKHVPMLEDQARPALKNNVLGTKTIAEAASSYKVDEFVLVSTDKAVNPTNIMGASKRVSELICQNINNRSQTRYVTVRFGNVLDSAGSVVPLFREQIRKGGPVTVTDPEITRFFMTIPEASQLIMQAAVLGNGGEIFILDMGEAVKIADLAKQMIMLSGKRLNEDIEIKFTRLRPGEKMHEELVHDNEKVSKTKHPKITLANSRTVDWEWLVRLIDDIEVAVSVHDENELNNILKKLVPEYEQPSSTDDNVIPFESLHSVSSKDQSKSH